MTLEALSEDLVWNEEDLAKSAHASVLSVEGDLISMTRVPSNYEKDQVEVVLENPIILEMLEGVPEPEIRDNKYTLWFTYAKPGMKPGGRSSWSKGVMKSAEVIGIKQALLEKKFPLHVTFRREDVALGFEDDDGNPVSVNMFVFVSKEAVPTLDIETHVGNLLIGVTPALALKVVSQDAKAKNYPEYRDAIKRGTIAEMLNLVIVDGKYESSSSVGE